MLEADGDGVVRMLDQSMSQELEVLIDTQLAHMLQLKDVIDLADESWHDEGSPMTKMSST